MPTHWAFYFSYSGLSLQIPGTWSGSMCNVYIALQELLAAVPMLQRIAFHLCNKVVGLYLDNASAKSYLCNQAGTVSLFLSTLAFHILNLADNHEIASYSSIYLPISMWQMIIFLFLGIIYCNVGSRMASSSTHSLSGVSTLGSAGGGFVGILRYQSMSALLYLGESITHGSLGVECFQPSLEVSCELSVSSFWVSSSSYVKVAVRAYHGLI